MNPLILMALIAAAPVLLIILFRVKATFVFLALCAGSVLTTFVSDAGLDLIQTFARSYSDTTQAVVQVGLLLLPAILTLIFLRATVSGSAFVLNILPALLTGVMTLYLVVPLLPPGTSNAITGTSIWDQLIQYQAVLVGSAVLFSVLQLWSGGRTARHKKKKH